MKYFCYFFFFCFVLISCRNEPPQVPLNKRPKDMTKEYLLELNKQLTEKENKEIAEYIAENNLTFGQSPLAFWYKIESRGEGAPLKKGDEVRILYNLSLLNGKICYTPEYKGDKIIHIGRRDIVKGLDDALLMLNEGGRGKFIIPSSLAFGKIGDGDCVEPHRTVIFDIISVKKSDF